MFRLHTGSFESSMSVGQKDPSENLYRKRNVLLLLLLLLTNCVPVSKKHDLLDFLISLIRLDIISVSLLMYLLNKPFSQHYKNL